MADPTKRRLGKRRHFDQTDDEAVTDLTSESVTEKDREGRIAAAKARRRLTKGSEKQLVWWVQPPPRRGRTVRPLKIDLTRYRDGALKPQRGRTFKGRPTLISSLQPAIVNLTSGKAEGSAKGIKTSLSYLFQFIDELEEIGVGPIAEAKDLDDTFSSILIKNMLKDRKIDDQSKFNIYGVLKRLCASAASLDGKEVHWPPNPWKQKSRDNDDGYDDRTIARLLSAAKLEAYAVQRRLKEGKDLLAVGRDPRASAGGGMEAWQINANRAWFVWEVLRCSLLSSAELKLKFPGATMLGAYKGPDHRPASAGESFYSHGIGAHYRWFLPVLEDLVPFLMIVAIRTGWNLQVILDLDPTDWWSPHPTRKDAVMIHSSKERAGGEIIKAFSFRDKSTFPFAIISYVINMTEPLRRHAREEARRLRTEISKNSENRDLVLRLAKLEDLERRVWLAMGRRDRDLAPVHGLHDHHHVIYSVASAIIDKHNVRNMKAELVQFATRDIRDTWVLFAYNVSGYNLIVAQLAAGHKRLGTILRYLNRRRVKRRTNEAMWALDRHLFAEIRVGRLDVRILRILVEKGGISEEEARNLLSGKTLTPTGAFCSDPHQPPPEKDPDHRTGAPCGTLECADCFRAYFFQDSLVPLAQQIIGLRSLRESMPLIDWFESDFPDDLEFHEMVMGRYPPKQVDAAFEQASLNNAPLLHFRPSRRQV